MGHMNRRQGALAGVVLLALAMTACSGPAPSDPALSDPVPSSSPAGPDSSPASASPAGPDASANQASRPDLGGFSTVPDACAAISGTAVSLVALPKAAATGNDSTEAEQARAGLEEIRGRVPADLKEHIEKLKSIADDAGRDYSKFNRNDFDAALAPVAGWLEAYC